MVPASAICVLAREALPGSRIGHEALDSTDWRLPGANVYYAQDEAAEILAYVDETAAPTE